MCTSLEYSNGHILGEEDPYSSKNATKASNFLPSNEGMQSPKSDGDQDDQSSSSQLDLERGWEAEVGE